jgi:membrane protease subunit HflK
MEGKDFGNVRVGDFRPPDIKLPRGLLTTLPLILIVLVMLWTTVYTVDPEEVGVVLTFGEFTGITEPGLHFKLPAPIQTYQTVPVQRQLKQEFGFRTVGAGQRSQVGNVVQGESLMLTGDLNVGVVEWTTQYRVVDPYKFIFRVRGVEETFRDMNEAVMRTVVGDRSVSEVLTVGRQEIASEVERRLQELCDQYETGIRIEQIVLQDVNPPEPVKPSFNEVNQSQQERERLINEARADFNREVPAARGEALRVVEQAHGYAVDRVNRAEGDGARFVALYDAYRRAPEVTRRRLYLETMLELLPQVRQKIVIDQDIEGLLPLLNLQGEVVRPPSGSTQEPSQ